MLGGCAACVIDAHVSGEMVMGWGIDVFVGMAVPCRRGGDDRACKDIVVFFFFFQAEDGIRDKLVTGVQTCALPISAGGDVDGPLIEKSPFPYYCRRGFLRRPSLRSRRELQWNGPSRPTVSSAAAA